jgi:hypothetical protein
MENKPVSELLVKQIQIARRRLILEQFFRLLPRSLSILFVLAAVASLAPKLIVLPYAGLAWATWSLAAACVLGLVLTLVLTWRKATSSLVAAVELDRRFQLKERVSSVLSLTIEQRETEAGRALVEDALRRASALDVKSEFGVQFGRRSWWPLVPAAVAFALAFFMPDKQQPPQAAASTMAAATKAQVDRSTEELRRKMAERRREAQEKGLNEAAGLFERIEKGTEEMKQKGASDREQALVKLNDLSKELEKRREALGSGEKIQKQLNKLGNLSEGPADKLADAMQNGDLKAARNELEKLRKQLADGKLDKPAQEKLQQQMRQMQQKLQQAADAHAQAMKDLQQQMQQAQDQGDAAQQQQLQQQLDKLAQQAPRMDQLKQMADRLGQAADGMKDANPQQTADALKNMTDQLEQLQKENEELEMLDDALDQIAAAKEAMNCKKCNGAGCEHCQGKGKGKGQQAGQGKKPGQQNQQAGNRQRGQPGKGIGVGRGPGLGPENEAEGNFFDTRVRQQVKEGQAVIVDRIDGPNIRGQVQQEVKSGITAATKEESDPLEGVRLPRAQRDHAREYFDSFREGKVSP